MHAPVQEDAEGSPFLRIFCCIDREDAMLLGTSCVLYCLALKSSSIKKETEGVSFLVALYEMLLFLRKIQDRFRSLQRFLTMA